MYSTVRPPGGGLVVVEKMEKMEKIQLFALLHFFWLWFSGGLLAFFSMFFYFWWLRGKPRRPKANAKNLPDKSLPGYGYGYRNPHNLKKKERSFHQQTVYAASKMGSYRRYRGRYVEHKSSPYVIRFISSSSLARHKVRSCEVLGPHRTSKFVTFDR